MRNLKPYFLSFSLFFLSSLLFGQNDTVSNNVWDNLPHIKTLPQEKVYLHFDKPYYVAGDRMWFRAYLVDAESHKPDTTSCAIYVELFNCKDSLIQRLKIRNKKGVYEGGILLNETSPEGIYSVRAYTNWMRNAGEDFFYHRQFFVGNSISSKVQSSIQYTFNTPKKVAATIRFFQKNSPLVGKKIDYYLNVKGQAKTIKTLTTNSNGEIFMEYNPQQIEINKPYIALTYEENLSKYERTYILPSKSDYDVQVFPEGGALVSGISNCVAFKAIQADGFSTEVAGKLYDNSNTALCDVKTSHLGMGKFYFLPDSSKQYYIEVENKSGEKKRFNLPAVKRNAYILSVNVRNKAVFIGIKSDQMLDANDSMVLVGHSRGAIFFNTIVRPNKTYTFEQSSLRPGIISFMLLSKKGLPLSERLVFIKPELSPQIQLALDNNTHQKRQKVNASIQVLDTKGKPIQGSFSLAVTDASDLETDSCAENIINTLLLSADIKGYIEKPNLYFDKNYKQADDALDILMLTQGWKRFDTEKLLAGEKPKAQHFLEVGQVISGKVGTGLNNKLTSGTKVCLLGSKINFFNVKETDVMGRFSFSNFIFPDSTVFTINAIRSRGLKNAVEIIVDQDTFPEIKQSIIRPETASTISDAYLESAEKKFVFENGIRNINLQDLEVVASRNKNEDPITETAFFLSQQKYVLEGAALDAYRGRPLSNLIRSLPGLQAWNETMDVINESAVYGTIENDDEPFGPQFFSDGDIYRYNEVQGVDVNFLSSVELLKANDSKASNYNDYLVVLNFKKNYSIFSKALPPTVVTIMPLGFSKEVHFYQPKYEVESVFKNPTPDWRSTLAWQSELKTDAKGTGNFWFYTADRSSAYNFIIEGVTPGGEPCRLEMKSMLFHDKR